MHTLSFIALTAAGAGLFWSPIVGLWHLLDKNELYSHIPLIPFVSGYFLVAGRKDIFSDTEWGFRAGLVLLGLGALIRVFGTACVPTANPNDCLSLHMLGLTFWVQGSFMFAYGVSALKHALFPMLFLLFIIPIPSFILTPFVRLLQIGSAEASYLVFKVIGVPLYREGFVFALPGFTVEVAEQCSGIRSSIALFITAIMAGKLFLRTGGSRILLALSVFPITMFKNALRIVTLSLLASYVDPRFITASWLHSSGGIPFFGVALLLLLPVVWILRRSEKRRDSEIRQKLEKARPAVPQ